MSFFLCANIFTNLFKNTLSLWSSINVKHQIPSQYKTAEKIMVLNTLIFMILNSRQDDRRFWIEQYQTFPKFNLLLITPWVLFLALFQNILAFPYFQMMY
jgi:hypothetical protein